MKEKNDDFKFCDERRRELLGEFEKFIDEYENEHWGEWYCRDDDVAENLREILNKMKNAPHIDEFGCLSMMIPAVPR